jgi:hypothetical protein
MGAPSTAFVRQYQAAITLLAQQVEERLSACVMVDTNWTGEHKYYNQYGTDTMVEITSRLQDTPIQDASHYRRRVTPQYFVSNTLEDPFEALQMLVDPKSTYMQAKKAAIARKKDLVIIQALDGTAYTGQAGATSVTLGTAQKVSGSSVGLTKAKLINAKKILDKAEVDKEDRFCTYGGEQLEDLLGTTEVTSVDYNTVKALVQGEILTWLGFNFIHTEQLTTDNSSDRRVYAFQRKGVQLAVQKDAEGRITERPDKNYAWQVYVRIALGATRLEEERVVEIACTE